MARQPTKSSPDTPGEPVAVTSEPQFDEIRTSAPRMLVTFYANWCGPCQEMEEPIQNLSTELSVPILKVDVESLPQLAVRFDVQTIPTVLAFADGEVKERFRGVQEPAQLRAPLED